MTNNDDRSGWMETASGRKFWPMNPRPEDVDFDDIVSGLSKKCRFNGQCSAFYSVAQHSVLVGQMAQRRGCSPQLQAGALLHDAAEAYLPDIVRPLKRSLFGIQTRNGTPFIEPFADIENRMLLEIFNRFGLTFPPSAWVKHFDDCVLNYERTYLMGNGHRNEWEPLPAYPEAWPALVPMTIKQSAEAFRNESKRVGLMI